MAADDTAVRVRLRRKLEETLGVEETDMLLDRPPGGWSELVTKEYLHLELGRLEAKFGGLEGKFGGLEAKVDYGFEALEAKLDAQRADLTSLIDKASSAAEKAASKHLRWTVGSIFVFGALLVAAQQL